MSTDKTDGFVLIGGASSRMGRDKAQMSVGGRKMYELAAASLSEVCRDNITLVGNSPDNCEMPIIADTVLDPTTTLRAPIIGVYTALAKAKTKWIAILACDLPFVTGDLIARLAGYCLNEFDAIVPMQPDGRPQPLCAFYQREQCLPVVADMISDADLKMQSFLARVNTRFVEFEEIADLEGSANFFLNLNNMDDYEIAQKISALQKMPDDKIAIFKQTELFRELDDTVVGLLAKHSVKKKLQRNEILFVAGEPAKGLYVIASGSVRAFRTSADGREQVIHVERAVTTIAEVPVFDDGSYPSTVAAEEPSILYFLSKRHVFDTAIAHPQLALAATKLIASRLRRCAELVETLSLREVGQRLARLLLDEAKVNGAETSEGTKIRLQLTHNQLAARIGTVREVVTRTFIRLQEQGLIVHKGRVTLITNPKKLAAYAEAIDNK